MKFMARFVWPVAVVGLLGFAFLSEGQCCPFCRESEKGLTLTLQMEEAAIVLYGHFENAGRNNDEDTAHSDFIIEKVLKSNDMLKNRTKLTIPRDVRSTSKFILFAEIYKGRIDAYKGIELSSDTEMLKYLEKAVELKGKPLATRLRFAFDYLNSPEFEVSMDAFREFARADYRDYKEMAKTLPPDTIAGWLQDPKTPSFRYGLYSSLLGHCGKAEHAKLLLEMINDSEKRRGSGLHGLMAAYTMLEPAKGWSLVKETVQAKEKQFMVRYAGLQTMRFFWEYRNDLVSKKDIVKGVVGILDVPDMADFAIEDLRKWKQWDHCKDVIGLSGKANYNTPIMRKAILRYALQCPTPEAAGFVTARRAIDPEGVEDTKELLEMESPSRR